MKINWLLFILCLSLSLTAVAQNCKFKIDKVDPITGKKTQAIVLKNSLYSSMSFLRHGDSLYVEGVVILGGEQNFSLPEGSAMEMKLGNDSILFLTSHGTAFPTTNTTFGASHNIITTYVIHYILTHAQAEQVKLHGIAFARMHTQGDMTRDISFSTKETEKSVAAALCIY